MRICQKQLSTLICQGHKDARKYITAKEKIVNIYVDPNKTEKVIVHMATTSSKQTTAKGTFMR